MYIDSHCRGYDAEVPNRTIYVSDDDLGLTGGPGARRGRSVRRDPQVRCGASSMSRRAGAKGSTRSPFGWARDPGEGPFHRRPPRRVGHLDGGPLLSLQGLQWPHRQVVLHVERTPDWTTRDAEGKPAGWRGYLGIGDLSYGFTAGESTLEVIHSLDELREKVPPELFEMVAGLAGNSAVEDLDI